jgi:hypothetical protein
MQAFEVLQHQNEILSKELKRLHITNNAKVVTEERLTAVLLDLKMSIDDIVSISGDKTTTSTTSTTNTTTTTTKSNTKTDIDSIHGIFSTGMKIDGSLDKVNDIKTSTKSKAATITGHHHSKQDNNSSNSSSIIWTKLQSRINDIKKQWEDALKDSRKLSCSGFNVHERTSQFIDSSNSNNGNNSKRISPNKALGVPSSARSTTSVRSTNSTTTTTTNTTTLDNFFVNSRNPSNIPIKFNDILGVRSPYHILN